MVDAMDLNRRIGSLLFIGGLQFAILLMVAETQFPEYSAANNYISDLGLWSYRSAYIFNPSVFIFGLCGLAANSIFCHKTTLRLQGALFIISSIGAMGVGIFNEMILVPHAVSALATFTFGGLATLSFCTRLRKPFSYIAAFLGASSLLAMILLGSGNHLGLGPGGMERMILYPVLMFVIGLGGYFLATDESFCRKS